MKKILSILFLAIVFLVGAALFYLKDFTITYGCVVVTDEPLSDFALKAEFDHLEIKKSSKCTAPFIVSLSEIYDKGQGEPNKVVTEINGVKFFLGVVALEAKDDTALIDRDEHAELTEEKEMPKSVQLQVSDTIEEADIFIFFIKESDKEKITIDEVEEAAVSIQTTVDKVHLIVTEERFIAEEKIIKPHCKIANVSDEQKFFVALFSVVELDSGEKVVSFID
ncbi:MAG: hypothetical protein ACOX2F_11975 [bacterium]